MADPYVLGRQLGSDGRDKVVYEGRRGASGPPWVAVAQFRTPSNKVHAVLRRKGHAKSTAKISIEADFQRRAADIGCAPEIIEEDLTRSRLVMQLLPGGTLSDLARKQGGTLTAAQQRRVVEILKLLGTPLPEGGAAMLHNDCGNPANFVADADGQIFVIDFGLAKDITRTMHPHANLHAIHHLLFDVQQGMVTHGLLRELPAILVREYRHFLDVLSGDAAPRAAPRSAGTRTRVRARPTARRSSSPPRETSASSDDDDEPDADEVKDPRDASPGVRGTARSMVTAAAKLLGVLVLVAFSILLAHVCAGPGCGSMRSLWSIGV